MLLWKSSLAWCGSLTSPLLASLHKPQRGHPCSFLLECWLSNVGLLFTSGPPALPNSPRGLVRGCVFLASDRLDCTFVQGLRGEDGVEPWAVGLVSLVGLKPLSPSRAMPWNSPCLALRVWCTYKSSSLQGGNPNQDAGGTMGFQLQRVDPRPQGPTELPVLSQERIQWWVFGFLLHFLFLCFVLVFTIFFFSFRNTPIMSGKGFEDFSGDGFTALRLRALNRLFSDVSFPSLPRGPVAGRGAGGCWVCYHHSHLQRAPSPLAALASSPRFWGQSPRVPHTLPPSPGRKGSAKASFLLFAPQPGFLQLRAALCV